MNHLVLHFLVSKIIHIKTGKNHFLVGLILTKVSGSNLSSVKIVQLSLSYMMVK